MKALLRLGIDLFAANKWEDPFRVLRRLCNEPLPLRLGQDEPNSLHDASLREQVCIRGEGNGVGPFRFGAQARVDVVDDLLVQPSSYRKVSEPAFRQMDNRDGNRSLPRPKHAAGRVVDYEA